MRVGSIQPLCKRCGRLKPGYLRRHRRELGLMMHLKACCCDALVCDLGNFINVSVNVDSSLCSGCNPRGGQWEDYTLVPPSPFVITGFDGTYQVEALGNLGGGICNFETTQQHTNGTDFWAISDVHSNSSCTSLQGGELSSTMTMSVHVDIAALQVVQAYIRCVFANNRPLYAFSAQGATVDLGSPVSDDTTFGGNPRACNTNPPVGMPAGSGWKVCQGGTITVTAA